MAVNTLITIKDALTAFADAHDQIQRIEFEADDHRAPEIESGNTFPVMFVAPISVRLEASMNVHRLKIYVYERINDDRDDVIENANDTSLMLRDIRVWWNESNDLSDIHIIENPTGEFVCDRELDNLEGYYAFFDFEIPAHSRCEVPINITPVPSPSCLPAEYTVQYVDGTLIESGTIPSGGSVVVNVPLGQDATYTLTDTDGNTLDSGTIASGGSAVIVAPDASYEIRKSNNALLYSGNILSGGSLTQLINDSTVRVRKSDNTVIQSVGVRAESIENYNVVDSVITLQNSVPTTISTTSVKATDTETITAPDATAVLKDTGGTTISIESIPSNVSEDIIAPDATVNVNQSDGNLISAVTVASGATEPYNVPDSIITLNTNEVTENVQATDGKNFNLLDADGNAIAVDSVSGDDVTLDVSKLLELLIPYSTSDTSASITVVTDSDGTITTADTTGLTSVVYEVNSTVVTLPFTLAVSDVLDISFDSASSDGTIKLTGNYV